MDGDRDDRDRPVEPAGARLTGYQVQPNKAIVGRNAFAHEAGIHQDGVLKERTTYEIMDATTVGLRGNAIVLGKHSGRHALREALEELGFQLDGQALRTAFKRFKEIADVKKQVTAMDLEALVTDELRVGEDVAGYTLEWFEVEDSSRRPPHARVAVTLPEGARPRVPSPATARSTRCSGRSTPRRGWRRSSASSRSGRSPRVRTPSGRSRLWSRSTVVRAPDRASRRTSSMRQRGRMCGLCRSRVLARSRRRGVGSRDRGALSAATEAGQAKRSATATRQPGTASLRSIVPSVCTRTSPPARYTVAERERGSSTSTALAPASSQFSDFERT